uniref:SH2 domain-containing protein n=1 Tax=Globisporangium ultimum (strain ATCC 200006 / CBS 805.95 / DAOM BR144) TaxID=431595 RepID=K3WHZ3_GLOUD
MFMEDSSGWWDRHFGAFGARIPFKTLFFPALLQSCGGIDAPTLRVTTEPLSTDELATLVKFCLAESAWTRGFVTKQDVVSCFCVNRELVPWFHGVVSRAESERVLASYGDGAFLIRFSETHPTKFTLSYMKIHTLPPHEGRREMKNCLIENLGARGYVLSASSKATPYASIMAFVQQSAKRLKHGVASPLAKQCNSELADIRALQDQQSNSYTAFSAETLDVAADMPSPSRAKAMLFAQSPPRRNHQHKEEFFHSGSSTMSANSSECCSESYSGFSLDTVTRPPPRLPVKTNASSMSSFASSSCVSTVTRPSFSDADYGDATFFNNDLGTKGNNQQSHNTPGCYGATQEMGDYGSLQVFMIANQQPLSPSHCRPETKAPPFKVLLSPSRRHSGVTLQPQEEPQVDAYGTFESFASTFAAESKQLAQRQGLAVSLSKTHPPSPPHGSSISTSGEENTYGSFASFSVVTKPSNSLSAAINNSVPDTTDTEYGSFASLDVSMDDAFALLGPPPPPPTSQFQPPLVTPAQNGSSSSDQDENGNVYGSFETLMIRNDRPSSSLSVTATVATTKPTPLNEMIPTPQTHTHSAACSALDELNAGMAHYQNKRLDEALACFIHAQEVAKSSDDKVVEARALGNLGTVYLDQQNPQQAVMCYQQCLDITRSIQDTKRERTILNNLVLALMASNELCRALTCCDVQLEMTTNAINRRKILSRMSLLRERIARQGQHAASH